MPEPAEDEVLLKVLAAGICGSDVPRVLKEGVRNYPTIPGHEFVGEIVAAGTGVEQDLVGKKAAVFPLLPCFTCTSCLNENYAACVDYDYYGSRRDGAFAEYIAVRAWNLVPIPDGVKTSWAAMAEPCAVAVHALGKAGLEAGDTVCIFGAGTIGLILAQLARANGAGEVILLDVDERKLTFVREQGFHALDSMDDGYIDTILHLTSGNGADVCIDAAGASATVAGCLKAAAAFGTVVLLGNPAGDISLSQKDYWDILRKELKLLGTWNSDYGTRKNDWSTAIDHMKDGKLELDPLITHIFSLEEGKKAFDMLRRQDEFSVKVLLAPHRKDI